jgi:hypothetical protein
VHSAMRLARPILAVLVLVACTAAPPDPGLRVAGDMRPVQGGAYGVAPGDPVAWGSIILCLREPGAATIEQVRLVDPTRGLSLDVFAVRPNPYPSGGISIGLARDDLLSLGLDPSGARIVDTTCPESDATAWTGGSELVFAVSYPAPVDAATPPTSPALDVTYAYGGADRGTLRIPFGVQLCPATCP